MKTELRPNPIPSWLKPASNPPFLFEDPTGEQERDLNDLGLGCAVRGMPQGDVPNLMGEDTGHLGLVVGRGDEAGVHIDGPAGQREGVDVGVGNDLKRVRVVRRGRCVGETLANAGDVRGESLLLDDGNFLLDLGGGFLAELDVLFG